MECDHEFEDGFCVHCDADMNILLVVCPSCSEAGGANRIVQHIGPPCPHTKAV